MYPIFGTPPRNRGARSAIPSPLVWFLISLQLCFNICAALAEPNALLTLSKVSNETLFWGAFRPNLYFGVRPRIPKGFVMGLSWTTLEDYHDALKNMRYTCEQDEITSGYGWTRYDARLGGVQVIKDHGNGIEITTSFIKDPAAGLHGGNWGVRVRGTIAPGMRSNIKTGVFLHLGLETDEGIELLPRRNDELGFEGKIHGVGAFEVTVKDRKGEAVSDTVVTGVQVGADRVWLSKNVLLELLLKTAKQFFPLRQTAREAPPPHVVISLEENIMRANLQLVQKQFTGNFEFDVLFQSETKQKMTSEVLSSRLRDLEKNYDSRFNLVLSPQPPFNRPEYEEFSKSLLSNLVGGIGYFYGDTVVDRSYAEEYDEDTDNFWEAAKEAQKRADVQKTDPMELFTSVPSRPFFPRGFFWDEGFHLVPVVDWDIELAMQITRSWFNLMDEDGWIGREQIMGDEGRMKVPLEFQVQYPHYANPPTLFLTIASLIGKVDKPIKSPGAGSDELEVGSAKSIQNMAAHPNDYVTAEIVREYLTEMYPLLKKHYQWFRRTQAGDSYSYDRPTEYPKEVYRWKGRTATHLLTSGLDDYPRPQPPHPGELHVDAASWAGFMAQNLRRIANFLGEKDDEEEFMEHEQGVLHNLDFLHWDPKAGVFCDITVDRSGDPVRACHTGYVSLMPFMLGLMRPDDIRISSLMKAISSPLHLWTNHGIRSLGASDSFYGTGENYWRGPIWLNMNYMILKALKDVATSSSHAPASTSPSSASPAEIENMRTEAASLYSRLRKVLVQTVFKEWKRTGFAWEQYDPNTGEGRRTEHFTGWTSLVTKIMAMEESVSATSRERGKPDGTGRAAGRLKEEL